MWQTFRTKILGPLLLSLVMVGALVLVSFGVKVYLGDIIRKLLGKPLPDLKSLDAIPVVDPDRKDSKGEIIPPGTPDDRGWVQPVVIPVDEPTIFDSSDSVKVVLPGDTKPTEILLPKGVSRDDVKEVVVLKPDVVTVTVDQKNKVPVQTLDDLMNKYGRK